MRSTPRSRSHSTKQAGAAGRLSAVPHWQLALPAEVRAVHSAWFGVQRHSPAEPSLRAAAEAVAAIRQALEGVGLASIETFDVMAGHDMPGARVLTGVCVDAPAARAALAAIDLPALHASLGHWRHSVGLWREEFTSPVEGLVTAYTGPDPLRRRPGMAALPNAIARAVEPDEAPAEPALRPAPNPDVLRAAFDPTLPREVPIGYGERLAGRNRHPLMFLRFGCDWTECSAIEFAMGARGMSVLAELALGYLWANPVETGAYGLRQMAAVGADEQPRAERSMGCFMRDAAAVAAFREEQAAHLASFQRLLDQEGLAPAERRLRLHEEISVLAPGAASVEYVNCGPRTGVQRFLELDRSRLPIRPDLA